MVDFANQSIGHGMVQEEQLFLTKPIVAMMLQIDPMTPDQAILIQNVIRTLVVDIKGIGYIADFVAIDAGDYSKNKKKQYYKQNIDKDCHKVFVGFNHLSYNTVRSGLWGCGAFGGDPQVLSAGHGSHVPTQKSTVLSIHRSKARMPTFTFPFHPCS